MIKKISVPEGKKKHKNLSLKRVLKIPNQTSLSHNHFEIEEI